MFFLKSKTMIPPKLLMDRRTHSDTNLDTLQERWRRKKSCGDLFQNGYRVRQGHHAHEDKGRQTGPYHSVWSCLCILSNWGKSARAQKLLMDVDDIINPDLDCCFTVRVG